MKNDFTPSYKKLSDTQNVSNDTFNFTNIKSNVSNERLVQPNNNNNNNNTINQATLLL